MKKIIISLSILSMVYGQFPIASENRYIDIVPELPELVPYRIVRIDLQPHDCNLEVGIELIHPYHIIDAPTPQQQETLDIIYKRIGYEIVNPNMSAGLFHIDGKLYHLIRIPYTGTIWNEND